MEKVLIVVDMQKDFIDGALGTKEAEAIVDRAAAKIAGFEGRIFFTLDTHGPNYLKTAEGRKLPVVHCIEGEAGWMLDKRIGDAMTGKERLAFPKRTFAAVKMVEELARMVALRDIEVELIGLCTDICVVSNALLLKAHFPEMPISVDASCCAGVTPASHAAALETMRMCQIDIIGA